MYFLATPIIIIVNIILFDLVCKNITLISLSDSFCKLSQYKNPTFGHQVQK